MVVPRVPPPAVASGEKTHGKSWRNDHAAVGLRLVEPHNGLLLFKIGVFESHWN